MEIAAFSLLNGTKNIRLPTCQEAASSIICPVSTRRWIH
jgi:hypothetical protein